MIDVAAAIRALPVPEAEPTERLAEALNYFHSLRDAPEPTEAEVERALVAFYRRSEMDWRHFADQSALHRLDMRAALRAARGQR